MGQKAENCSKRTNSAPEKNQNEIYTFIELLELTRVLLLVAVGLVQLWKVISPHPLQKHLKENPKTDYQHPLFEGLPEQWESYISSLQWQKPQQAHVIDSAGRMYRMTTLPLPEPPVGSPGVEALTDQLLVKFAIQTQEEPEIVPPAIPYLLHSEEV